MSKKPNLDAMSVDEVWQLHEEIIRVLSGRLASEKRQLEKRLEQLRREQEVSLPDKLKKNALKEPQKYPSIFPKFRNSNEPFETWSGRGKQPRWLTAALRAGHTIDEFAIRDLERIRTSPRRKRSDTV